MKFYLAEGNIGSHASREQAEAVVTHLRAKGWDVEYGLSPNRATEIHEFGQEEQLTDRFAADFMACLDEMGL
jgi:hypothetical protein